MMVAVFLMATWLVAMTAQAGAQSSTAELPPPISRSVDFKLDVAPLLEGRCLTCHGPQQQMNGLRLDRREDALRGGYSGPVIRPGKSAESRLIHLVGGLVEGIVMPKTGRRLTSQEIGILRAWIDQGAEWPVDGSPLSVSSRKQADGSRVPRSSHWAFQPIQQPPVPSVGSQTWARNGIDGFILDKLETQRLTPSPEADKSTLIRRLSLDLIGLPPTPPELEEFMADTSEDGYEHLVDRLLDSPHFGERRAMSWLDVARYADSDGYEKDRPRPHAWRYRRWVINAFNDDMPFDQFSVEQIAGDLLPDATTEQTVATGFHRNTLTNREGGVDIEQARFERVVDRANTVSTAWLALSIECAQCHDHKYDPITQKDYYQFFAFFNNAEEVDVDAALPGEMGPYMRTRPEFEKRRSGLLEEYGVPELQPRWEERMRQAAVDPGKWTDWDHAFDALQKYLDNGYGILQTDPARRTPKEKKGLTDHFVINYHRVISRERREELNFQELRKKIEELDTTYPALSQAQSIAESGEQRKSHIHVRGEYGRKGTEVQPGTPAFLFPLPPGPRPSRLQLAQWITSPENPLTARVFVNRMWQELFGAGLVKTSEDFGTQGEHPSHPRLLDWLASEFVNKGWSVKQTIKLMVMSSTYRQSSRSRPELEARDPDNSLLARQSRLRLPAELIRDSALAVGGLLYPAIGGRSVHPPQPSGVTELAYADAVQWQESQGKDRYGRGLYIHFQRTVPYPFLMNFDAPNTNVTSCRRDRSNTPLQALNLLNDPVFLESAQGLAERTLREAKESFEDRLHHAFRLCLARHPDSSEVARLSDYFQRQREMVDEASAKALMPISLPNVSRAQSAAWVGLASVLLNLDEFITRE